MKMRTPLLTAAIAFSLPAFAMAQEADKAVEKQTHKEHKQAKGVDKQLEAGQATFGNLIAALNNIDVEIDELEALKELSDVQVVNVEDVVQGNNVEALNNALNRNQTDIDALQNFLNGVEVDVVDENNDILTFDSVLNDNNVVVNDVVAIDVASGELVLFVQDQTTATAAATAGNR